MSLELVNTLATLATFVVIAATAIAAIVQLRHARSNNQIAAFNEFRAELGSAEMLSAQRFVTHDLGSKLDDPAFRYQMANWQAVTGENQESWKRIRHVANFYEAMGGLVKAGLVDKELVLDFLVGRSTLTFWKTLVPIVAILRESAADNSLWENFEYLAVLSEDWEAAYPDGTYPAGVRRMPLDHPWREADKQYAASLAPA